MCVFFAYTHHGCYLLCVSVIFVLSVLAKGRGHVGWKQVQDITLVYDDTVISEMYAPIFSPCCTCFTLT